MSKLAGKVALVTGASKGIGASIAEYLSADGASVVVNYASSKTGADAVVKRIKDKGGKAIAVQADVSKAEDIKRLIAETKAAYGKLDILVNNAGIYDFKPLSEITPEHFHKQFDINVLGLLLTTKEALPLFGPEGGSVINIGSVVGSMPVPGGAVYCSTKAARWMRLRFRFRRSWGRRASESIRLIRGWWRRRASIRRGSRRAISRR